MEIHFHGATQTVTGSLHEIRGGGKTILLDCGLFQGNREQAKKINCCFDFDPKKIDAVILSHAHTDHCGNLPNLVKQGYTGPIYCTPATAAITALMLMDSAKIQEEDAAYLNQKSQKSWQGEIKPLYTREDAQQTIALFKSLDYKQPLDLGGLIVEFHDAGHTLGSAAIKVTEPSTGKILVFSGDVGRPNAPLLHDPDPFLKADAFISECTYGGKVHGPMSAVATQLADVINRTMNRGGVLMVPAFALGRTQIMIEEIHILRDQKKIPASLPIFIDAPLATRITQVHRDFDHLLDEDTRKMLEPFDFPNLTYIANVQESIALNQLKHPYIVIAGSGMCESGRILHHLKHHIRDSRSTVLLPGYQAQNTLGRKIQDRQCTVPILGDIIPLNCEVDTLEGLSAHADSPELLEYTAPLKPTKIFLVHGELPQAHAHQQSLNSHGFPNVTIPARGDVVTV